MLLLSDLVIYVLLGLDVLYSLVLFFTSLFGTNEKNYTRTRIFLILFQLLCGLAIVIGYEKLQKFWSDLILLIVLVINTISMIIFLIKNNKIRKSLNRGFSIMSVLAILCGILFSGLYTMQFINHLNIGYDMDVRAVLCLEDYDKDEAEELLENLYDALAPDEYTSFTLHSIWEDHDDSKVYDMVISESNGDFLPPNQMKMIVTHKTKIDKIYWEFNDDLDIVFYENGKQVDNYKYIYNCSKCIDEPYSLLKESFENDVKETLVSPSSAIFTYKSLNYDSERGLFVFKGWVESQNAYAAMIKKDFYLTLLPSDSDNSWNYLTYSWEYVENY